MRIPSFLMRFLLFAFLSLAAWHCACAERSIRVAVAAEDEPNLAALLQTKLAARKNLELLSRTDLPLLEREMEESGSGRLKLPGVDRLVVVTGVAASRAVRVTDCASGAVVFEASLPANLGVPEAAEILNLRLPRYLQLSPKADAMSVSLLGFRFPERSADNRSVEARLNLACAIALQDSREAVVLERWRMKDLVFENSLREEAIGPFWNSAVMVQGAISRDGEQLVVALEVKNPADGAARIEEVRGTISDLPGLGMRLAAAITKPGAASAGSPKSEAAAYLKESEWLVAHQLFAEAAQAVECAVALEPDSREAQIQRIRTYAVAAYPDNLSARNFIAVLGYGRAIKRENIRRAVTMAGEMTRLMGEYMERYPAANEDTLEDPVSLGIRSLLTSLYTLTAAYDFDYHLDDPAGVEALRAATERNGKILRGKAKVIFRSNVDLYLTNYAGYWCPTPEATLEEYRASMGRDFATGFPQSWPSAIRYSLSQASGNNPPLLDVDGTNRRAARPENVVCRMVAWKPGDEGRVRELWETYLKELETSDDLLKKADALYFRWSSQALDKNREEALRPILDFLERHSDALYGPDGRALALMLTAPLERLSYVSDGNLCARYLEILTGLFMQDAPLPDELIQRISQSFGYRRKNDIPVEKFKALQSAMTRHMASWKEAKEKNDTVRKYYLGMVANALGALKGISPGGGAREEGEFGDDELVAPPLIVSRLWRASQYMRGNDYLDGSSGTWRDGYLWFAQRDPVAFWRIDPETFQSEAIGQSGAPDQIMSLNGDSRPLFRDGQIFVSGMRDVWAYDLGTKRWNALGMPGTYYRLYMANGALWTACGQMLSSRGEEQNNQGTCLYRIDTKNRKAELIFSTRRRPARHPMDSTEVAAPLGVFSGASGQPIIGLIGKEKKYVHVEDGIPWAAVQPKRVWDRACHAEQSFLVQRLNAPRNGRTPPLLEAVVSVDQKGRSELLLVDPRVTASGEPPMAGDPVWKAPLSLNDYPRDGNRYYAPAMEGDRFYVLVGDKFGSNENFTTILKLYVFHRGRAEAVCIPLQFQMPGQGRESLGEDDPAAKKFLNPWVSWHSFLAGPKGLVISWSWGFWFIPIGEIDQAISRAEKPGGKLDASKL